MDEESQKPKHEPIDYFDPLIITAFVTAFVCDLLAILIIPHYFGAVIITGILWSKIKWPLGKLIWIAAIIIPIPGTLTLGVFFALLLSNKIIAEIAIETTAVVATVFTGGGGVVVGGVATGAEGAAVAAEGVQAAGVVVEVGATTAEVGAEAGTATATGVTAGAGEAATAGTEGVQVVGGAVEVAEDAGEEAVDKSTETLKDKAVRKLKEKFKEKIRKRVEQGFGGDENEEYQPTQQEIDEEIRRQQKEDRALGEPEPVMEGLERGLFAQAPPFDQADQQQEEPTSRPVGGSSGLHVVGGRNTSKSKPTTQDILAKSEERQAQIHKNRQDEGDVDDLAA